MKKDSRRSETKVNLAIVDQKSRVAAVKNMFALIKDNYSIITIKNYLHICKIRVEEFLNFADGIR